MGDKVRALVSGYIEELEGKATRKAPKPVTFSMRLSERDHAKLLWLANSLDVPKTPLAEDLLKAAVDEAIEQYAGWASSEDPEGFLNEALKRIENLERGSSAHDAPEPPPPPHHEPPPPRPGHRPPKPGRERP